jgi:hypothetical protein
MYSQKSAGGATVVQLNKQGGEESAGRVSPKPGNECKQGMHC